MHRSTLAILATAIITLTSCSNPAQAGVARGDALLVANKVEEAFNAYDAAVTLDPDSAAALAGRGCSRTLAESDLGMADLDRAIELDPRSFAGHRCRAESHRAAGDLDAALSDAAKAVDLDADSIRALVAEYHLE